ncbi:hypothetical protein Tco_0696772 [Tanacetum coccineum]
MSMTIQSSVKDKILATPSETSKVENAPAEMLRDLDQQMEKRADDGGTLWIKLYSEYKYEIRYHPGKANVVIDALSRNGSKDIMRACVIDFGGSYQLSIRCAPFEALYGRKCRSPVLWAEIGESSLIGPELVQETTDKVSLRYGMGYAKVFALGKVYSLGKKGKLAPSLHVSLDEIEVDKTLRFVEEPVENSDCEVMRLKCSRMVIVKVRFWLEARSLRLQAKLPIVRYLVKVSWNSKCNFELTWVWEDYLKDKFGNQSIEHDRLIGIGFVLDFVEFISFTFGDKEMILWFKRFSD